MDKLECPHCSAPLGNGVTVCGECGSELNHAQEATSLEPAPVVQEVKSSGKKVYAALAVFLIVVGGAALLLFSGVVPNPFRDSTTAAIVNGEKISQAELNQKFETFKRIYSQTNQMDFSSPQAKTMVSDMKRQLLYAMIQEKILLTEAAREKITVSPQDISDRISAIKKAMNLSDQEFEAFLKNHAMNLQNFEKRVEREALINKLIAKGVNEKGLTKEAWLKQLNDRAKVEISMK